MVRDDRKMSLYAGCREATHPLALTCELKPKEKKKDRI